MSNLLDSLKSLKNKLNEIEESTVLPKEVEKVVVDNKEIVRANLQELKEIQKKRCVINVGGKPYSFSLDTISSSLAYNNIFNTGEKSIFYDGSPDLFAYIAEFLRALKKKENFEGEKTHKITLKIGEDEVVLKEMIKEIFPRSEEEIFPKLKIDREVIIERVVNNQPEVTAPIINNNNYNNAQYNNGYGY